MSNCALIYFESEREPDAPKKGLFARLARLTRKVKAGEEPELLAEILLESDDFKMFTVRLPLSQSDFRRLKGKRKQRLNDRLDRLCKQNRILCCHISKSAVCLPANCIVSVCSGELLFKCMLKSLLDQIYTNRGIKIGDLNIIVVEGNDSRELMAILEAVAPYVRYISVLSGVPEEVGQMVESLYEEYGLSIGVSQDFRNCFKDANLVINLGELGGFPFRPGFNANSIIINYGKLDNSYIPSDVTVINGIETALPTKGFNKSADVLRSFSVNEIAELFLLNKLNIENWPVAAERNLIGKISLEFMRCGFSIQNVKGRHSTIGINDIRV